MKTQIREKRLRNFDEVSLGISKREAVEEARRYPQFSDPAYHPKNPLGVDIPGFIRFLREGNVKGSLDKIKESNEFPSITSRVGAAPVPSELVPAESKSHLDIRALERFAADYGRKKFFRNIISKKEKKVAVIGSGPCGMAAAACLSRSSYQVAIFEMMPQLGGMLRYKIPSFRLPRNVLDRELNELRKLGVEIRTNCIFGQNIGLQGLENDDYSAVLLAVGSGGPKISDIPGANLSGVYYADELLTQLNALNPSQFEQKSSLILGQKVVVIGSDDGALDCCRICLRLARRVTMIFNGAEGDLNVDTRELSYAKEEGADLEPLTVVNEIKPDRNNFVEKIECSHLDYADPDSDGNWQLLHVPGSDFTMDADTVIIASSLRKNTSIKKAVPDLKMNENGEIWIDEQTGMTSLKNIFAAGEAVGRQKSVSHIMASGKKCAERIMEYLK